MHTGRKSDIEFSYRHSNLKTRNLIVIKINLNLKKGNKAELLKIVSENNQKRIAAQPIEYPSAGSVFKNPEGDAAGRIIEHDLGLKGYTIGGAKISEKHANFIINYDNATSEEIIRLIKYIQKEAKEKCNIDLILEQQIVE